jgi:hypothetical protein
MQRLTSKASESAPTLHASAATHVRSVYLLYRYKSTNPDAAHLVCAGGRVIHVGHARRAAELRGGRARGGAGASGAPDSRARACAAYVSIREHTSAYVSMRQHSDAAGAPGACARACGPEQGAPS